MVKELAVFGIGLLILLAIVAVAATAMALIALIAFCLHLIFGEATKTVGIVAFIFGLFYVMGLRNAALTLYGTLLTKYRHRRIMKRAQQNTPE